MIAAIIVAMIMRAFAVIVAGVCICAHRTTPIR